MARRPRRRDISGVLLCTCAQAVLIGVTAAAQHGGAATRVAAGPTSIGAIFAHNASVFLLWLSGTATLGLMTVVLSVSSSVISGLSVGALVDTHGLGALVALSHAGLELPALAIALWLSLRPLRWVVRSRWGAGSTSPFLPFMTSGLFWMLGAAGVLLLCAAVLELVVAPT